MDGLSGAPLHPELRVITMSPGNTLRGPTWRAIFPAPVRLLMKYVLAPVVMPLLGIVHPVERGAARLVQALDDPSH